MQQFQNNQDPQFQQQQQQQQQPQLCNPNLFCIIVPGLKPIVEYENINQMFVTNIYNPSSVSSITFFLISQLPEQMAACLYYSSEPYQNLQFIGAIANTRTTDTFHTGFPLKPDVNSQQMIKLVIKVESLDGIKSLVQDTENNDISKNYAKLVAKNLYNFMLSYQQMGLLSQDNEGKYLVVPSNFLEKWMQKFDSKYKFDPNFIYKTCDD